MKKKVLVDEWGDRVQARACLENCIEDSARIVKILHDYASKPWKSPPLPRDKAQTLCDGINKAGGSATIED